MLRRIMLTIACAVGLWAIQDPAKAQAQQAYGRTWGRSMATQDWNRLYHYPYVYYPQNFYGEEYYQSQPDMYYRYVPEMRIPVYNKGWFNEYPNPRRYYQGAHFNLDVF